jgi:hypothetical protein
MADFASRIRPLGPRHEIVEEVPRRWLRRQRGGRRLSGHRTHCGVLRRACGAPWSGWLATEHPFPCRVDLEF